MIDFIPFGYIDSIGKNYIIVDKFLYKTKVFTNSINLSIGNLVKTDLSKSKIIDQNLLKNNVRFNNYNDLTLIKNNTLYSINYLKCTNLNTNIAPFIKKIVFNEYINSTEINIYTGYGLCSYFLLRMIFKRNIHIGLFITIFISIMFGYETKYLIIVIDYLLSFFNIDSLNKYSLKLLIIIFINYHLLFNYSFLISLLLGFIKFINLNEKVLITIIQSTLFGNINLFLCFFYKYYIYFPIIFYILSLIVLYFPFSNTYIYKLIIVISRFIELISIDIRGSINVIFIVVVLIISKYIKNNTLIIFFCIVLILSPLNNPICHISFIDVGQGDSIFIKGSFEKYNILIDTGSIYNYQKLKNFLFKEGVYKIDFLIISHDDSDHNGNIENLKNDFKISNIISSNKDIKYKDLYLKNLFIDKFNNDNENSLVYLLDIYNTKFLFTGDITKNVEKILVKKYDLNNIDVLKVSHHGSKTGTSNDLLSVTLPKIAIISTNGNYGHPNKEVIDLLNSFLIKTYITKNDGNISFYITNSFKLIKTALYHFDIIES